ncbi:hypothetical protein [Candidatus Nanohalococcus occultus]|uniref:Type I restriction enzyme R protein N-terminal domain-containing protein n=1 Tax=Candidatus Nanohalococcus occultus TaxID=2978047 RepID=A0ABY8CGC0_9ARCH|nr:hypothetical protein SVXNc_0506 [Candidatus Nanohaloarchaeota archaeon SVXNc]
MKKVNWDVFQRDVLDVFRQYEGYFDFFERVGALSEYSRPDCFARITREGKKEIWIVDMKNKSSIDSEDAERMEKYSDRIESDPVDIGLNYSELSEHSVRKIIVTPEKADTGYENVPLPELHQFLQKELIYTETDKVVRDVAKLMNKGQLSQEQARLLYRSVEQYQNGLNQIKTVLNQIEQLYVGAKVDYSNDFAEEYGVAVDAVITHEKRRKTFLIDVPYNEAALQELEDKMNVVRDRLKQVEGEVFYAAVNRFESSESSFIYQPDEFEAEFQEDSNVVSARQVAELFEPKIPVEKHVDNGTVVVENVDLGFRLKATTEDDIKHRIEVRMPEKAAKRLSETRINARKQLGELNGQNFSLEIEIGEDLEVSHSGITEDFKSFTSSVQTVFCSGVNPALAKLNNGFNET